MGLARALSRGALAVGAGCALGFLFYAQGNLAHVLEEESTGFSWVVILKEESRAGDVGRLLKSQGGVVEAELIPREKVHSEFLEDPAMGADLEVLGTNPFPTLYRIRWESASIDPESLKSTALRIGRWPGVDSVEYDSGEALLIARLRTVHGWVKAANLSLLWGTMTFVLARLGSLLWRSAFTKTGEKRSATTLGEELMPQGLGGNPPYEATRPPGPRVSTP